jgi:hypothetical protein
MNPFDSAISSKHAIFNPCRCSNVCTKCDDDRSESNVPASSHATPRPSGVTVSCPRRRYSRFTSVISSSPRGDGFSFLAIPVTSPS